ncbi:MAG: cyclic nucleotide-binding domain-containing protein [Cellvibrionaceae bacterium]
MSELQTLLTQYSPFDRLDADYVEQLAEHSQIIEAEKGKLLFRRGKNAQYRHFLIEGCVDLVDASFATVRVNADEERAKSALTDTSPTQVSAVAKSQVRLLQVEADFLDLVMAWSQAPALDESPAQEPINNNSSVDADLLNTMDLASAHVEVEEEQDGDWMSGLLASPLFARVPPAHIQTLFTRFEAQEVERGDVVVKEGATGDYFYVIVHGSAQVTNLTGTIDVMLEEGQFFGEEALVAETPRNAKVTMLSKGLLMRLAKEDFITLLHEPVESVLSFEQYQSQSSRYTLVDVRMPLEHRCHHVPGCQNLPLASLRERITSLSPSEHYLITDDAGRRSHLAAYLLCQAGFNAGILEGAGQRYEQNA